MSIRDVYISNINRLFNSVTKSEKVCFIFKGFNKEFFSILFEMEKNYIGDITDINDDYSINIDALEKNRNKLLLNFLQISNNISWGYYEEFILLCNIYNDIGKQDDVKVMIINNNLFDKTYPLSIEDSIKSQLFEYVNNDEKENEDMEKLMNYYSDVVRYSEKCSGLVYNEKEIENNFKQINFYNYDKSDYINNNNVKKDSSNVVNMLNLFEIKTRIQNGDKVESLYINIDEKNKDELYGLILIINELKIPYSINLNKNKTIESNVDDDKYIYFLKEYWGRDKKFRKINFYRDPDISNEIIEISQGNIISDIILQCTKTLEGKNDFQDIFITAPTGSGKSLLFQIPAIYLAKEKSAITIVITPLIALMRDQVQQLEKRNIRNVTFLNSEISFEEKESRIKKIKSGEISIIYMSPEMLLGIKLDNIIGNRKIGLLVVDEAHIVTTWGRDFRADYWFLGTYIEKLRKNKGNANIFPIVCLTATAVYMGREDTVNETINTLSLIRPKIYLGNVRRDDIKFDIKVIENKNILGGIEEFKQEKSKNEILKLIEENRKGIVYCPFINHILGIYELLDEKIKSKVGIYYGGYDKEKKIQAQEKFKNGEYKVMLCTKAFGMGIDISDIDTVYHYAPTGNLCDYVQEIGRAARSKELIGHAAIDFISTDLRYARRLNGLSSIKQYQLREMLRKIYSIYLEKKKRNMLVSPDNFSYLFGEDNLENKVKTGLLLLEKDLNRQIKVIIVRPRCVFTQNFVHVPIEYKDLFLKKYGLYAKEITDNSIRIKPGSYKNGDIVIKNSGIIYELNMSEVWEKSFSDYTFPDFKRRFFNGDLLNEGEIDANLSPRLRLTINYKKDYDECKNLLIQYTKRLSVSVKN